MTNVQYAFAEIGKLNENLGEDWNVFYGQFLLHEERGRSLASSQILPALWIYYETTFNLQVP